MQSCNRIHCHLAGSGPWLDNGALVLASSHVHMHTLGHMPKYLWGVATLHKHISFIRHTQPFHLPLQAHALINQILWYHRYWLLSTHAYNLQQ